MKNVLPTILACHYCAGTVDEIDGGADALRADIERWERVQGDAERFPNADLDRLESLIGAGLSVLSSDSANTLIAAE